GAGDDALIAHLEPALRGKLATETGVGSFRFTHALVWADLRDGLSQTRRSKLHRRVAEALEALHADGLDQVAADLAYHWSEAGPAAKAKSIHYARRAAEIALTRAAPEEAGHWFRRARELLDGADATLDAELACRTGQAEEMMGTPGWQETLIEAARAAEAIGDVELMAD